MKRAVFLITLILLCVGQSFGPKIVKGPVPSGSPSQPALPTSKLAFRWVASDLDSTPVQTWTDRIQGAQFTQGTLANRPTWATNGVSFNGSDEYFTVAAGDVPWKIGISGSDDGFVFIGSTTETSGSGVIFSGDNLNYLECPGNRKFYVGGTIQTDAYAVNQAVDIIWDTRSILTNGILSVTNTTITISEDSGIRYVGVEQSTTYWWEGTINEFCIYTNIGSAGFDAATKAAIHKYATNTYTFLSP